MLVAAGLDRDLHRLQPLRAPEPQHLARHLRRGRRALPRPPRRVAALPHPKPGAPPRSWAPRSSSRSRRRCSWPSRSRSCCCSAARVRSWVLPSRHAPAPHADRGHRAGRRRWWSARSAPTPSTASSWWGSSTRSRHGEDSPDARPALRAPPAGGQLEIDWVILAFSRSSYEETLDLLRAARRPDVHLSIVPRFFEVFASNATIQELEGMPVVNLPPMRLSRSVRFTQARRGPVVAGARAPRCCRRCFARRGAGHQARQPRPGVLPPGAPRARREHLPDRQVPHHGGRRRERAPRRSRRCNEVDGALFKIKDDPRITRVGALPAPPSLDELPQLWNVLQRRDEPRRPASVRRPRVRPDHRLGEPPARHHARASPASGRCSGRNDIPFDEMVKLDYIYVTNWSLWWDLKILLPDDPGRAFAGGGPTDEPLRGAGVTTRRRTSRGCSPTSQPGPSCGRGGRVIVVDDGSSDSHRRRRRGATGARCRWRSSGWAATRARAARSTAASARALELAPADALIVTLEADTTSDLDARRAMLAAAAAAPTSCSPPTTPAASS